MFSLCRAPISWMFFSLGVILFMQPHKAFAHKVNIFAYVENGQVVVDAYYSKSKKVNAGKVVVVDAATKEELLNTVTDEKGFLRFPIPTKAATARHDLKLVLVAGEGHQSVTLVSAEEFEPRTAPAASGPVKSGPQADVKQTAQPMVKTADQQPLGPVPVQVMSEAALEQLVERAVDRAVERKMAPVRQMLQQQAETGPGMVEIIGGIGYILGLFGVAAFVAAKRRERQAK